MQARICTPVRPGKLCQVVGIPATTSWLAIQDAPSTGGFIRKQLGTDRVKLIENRGRRVGSGDLVDPDMIMRIGDPHLLIGDRTQNALDWFWVDTRGFFDHGSGLQYDFERFAIFSGSKPCNGFAQGKALADQVGKVDQPGIDNPGCLPAIGRAAGGGGGDDQFLVMDQIRIKIDRRAILGKPAKEVDPAADGSQGRALIPGRRAPGQQR